MIGKTNILVVYAAMIPTAKLVMDMMLRLAEVTKSGLRGKISANVSKKDIVWSDVVLFVRGADPYMEKIGKAAHQSGRYCMMYLDDDLLNVPSDGIDTYKNALKGCLYWCDLLWSSNPNILRKYAPFMHTGRCMEEKVFEPIASMLPVYEDDGEVRILYAGSPGHVKNLQRYIIPALNNVYKNHKRMEVTFIGIREGMLKGVAFPATYVPWFSNMQKYREYIVQHRYHIGLAVIEDSEFYHCKFYNKFLEYTQYGVLGIYSDCDPYRFIVKDHVNGLLSRNLAEAWAEKLEEAMENPGLRKSCIENAQQLIRDEFNMEETLKQLLRKAPEFQSYRADHSCKVDFHAENIFKRLFQYVVSTQIGYGIWEFALAIWHFIRDKIIKRRF